MVGLGHSASEEDLTLLVEVFKPLEDNIVGVLLSSVCHPSTSSHTMQSLLLQVMSTDSAPRFFQSKEYALYLGMVTDVFVKLPLHDFVRLTSPSLVHDLLLGHADHCATSKTYGQYM